MIPEYRTPNKSPQDRRQYRFNTLSNGLKILLINDSNAYKSYCAILIGVGSAEDPMHSLGLAHFMEHMIFMGSSKFSSPTEYTSFMSINSGYENAETNDLSTVFNFQIATNAFEEAVIRTCDFLIHPIISPEYIQKERHAIHEQYVLAKNEDENRLDEVIKQFCVSPYNKFNMGNNQSLNKPHIYEQLQNFYKKYYSADIMNVVLYSNYSLDQMEDLFKHFQQIPNKNILSTLNRSKYFFKEGTKQYFQIQSLKNQAKLMFYWSLQNLPANLRYQIGFYLKYHLEYQIKYSLNQLLNELEYGTCEVKHQDYLTYSLIILEIQLTEQGEQNLKYVFGFVLKYLTEYLYVSKEIYEQMRTIENIKFQNYQIQDMEDYLCELVTNMTFMEPENLLSKSSFIDEFNRDILQQLLQNHIRNPSKYLLIYSSPDEIKQPRIQPIYGTKYVLKDMLEQKLHKKLPKVKRQFTPNIFLPLQAQYFKSPNTALNTPIILNPKNIYFYNPNIGQSKTLRGSIKMIIHYDQSFTFCHLLTEFIDELISQINEADFIDAFQIEYSCNYLYGRVCLEMNGIASILTRLLVLIGDKIKTTINDVKNDEFEDLEDIFDEAKDNLQDDLDNYYEEEMDELIDKLKDQLLVRDGLSILEMQKHLKKIKKNKFLKNFANLWPEIKLQWIFVGNFDPNGIIQICTDFEKKLGIQFIQQHKPIKCRQVQIMKIQEGRNIKHEIRLKDHDVNTSTCFIYFQAGKFSNQLLYILQLIANYLDEPFYSVLRTEKKLSYELQLSVTNTRGILGIGFMLISSTVNPQRISKEIHKFLNQWSNPEKMMAELNTKLHKLKNSIKIKYMELFATNEDLLDFISDQILNRTYTFNRKENEHLDKYIGKITCQQLITTWQQILRKGSLEILLVSKSHKIQYNKTKQKTVTFEQLKANAQYHQDSQNQFIIGLFS